MKQLFKRTATLGLSLLLGVGALSFAAEGFRSYDCETTEYTDFSMEVTAFEERVSHAPECTLIVRTNGTRPDFRSVHPSFTAEGPDHAYAVCFEDAEQAEEMLDAVENLRGVAYAECNGYVTAQEEEPAGNACPDHISWGIDYMQLDRFVDRVREGCTEETDPVSVAVVDSGIDATHPMFQRQTISGETFTGAPFNTDACGHGTAVASVVADCIDDLPIQLLSVKILQDDGNASLLTAANGIRCAVDLGADIINMSFASKACSQYLHEAIDYAIEKNSLPVICAGNYATNMDTSVCCPSHLQQAVIVSGCAQDNTFYAKSGYGSCIDVTAPAVNVLCANTNGGYTILSGTSFDAPHISAVAAIYKLSEPSANCARLAELLTSSVLDLGAEGFDTKFGWGVPWFGKMVTKAEILSLPTKTEYYYKEAFCADGLSLRVTYDDQTTEDLTEGFTCTSTDFKRGDNTVIVQYGQCRTSFTVHVKLRWWQWIIYTVLFGFLWY